MNHEPECFRRAKPEGICICVKLLAAYERGLEKAGRMALAAADKSRHERLWHPSSDYGNWLQEQAKS